ncbi:helix-turn-helix domain-containing protein [Thermococcus sp.]|uniref:helix-turn-helix transcriptional regulator n=1 Tax=Thermococcus sp. TaxID=35749 RepID=UPI002612F1C0|nr:helix-turn-helix domain-containing protein [Thermococcus sp.]
MRSGAISVLAISLMILLLPSISGQYSVESLSLGVYSDGYVKVSEVVLPENYTVSFSLPLPSVNVEGVVVLDENGNPLPYEINGSTLTVYFENATRVWITYYTPDLTSKSGAIWSLRFNSTVPVKITFPDNALIVGLTDIPLEITGNSILMPAGNHTISYVLQYRPTTEVPTTSVPETTAESSNSSLPPHPGSSPNTPDRDSTNWITIGTLALLVLAAGSVIYMKHRKDEEETDISREDFAGRLKEYELTKDEEKALLYLFDRGGRARQAEIREMLGIPKTTAWRMFQRLEKQGLVRIYKKKRDNWVELRL